MDSRILKMMREALPDDAAVIDGMGLGDAMVLILAARLRAAVVVAKAAEELTDGNGSLVFGPVMAGPERDRLQNALDEWNRAAVDHGG